MYKSNRPHNISQSSQKHHSKRHKSIQHINRQQIHTVKNKTSHKHHLNGHIEHNVNLQHHQYSPYITQRRHFSGTDEGKLYRYGDRRRDDYSSAFTEPEPERSDEHVDKHERGIGPQSYYQLARSRKYISPYYTHVNAKMPQEYWDYQIYSPTFGALDNYTVHSKLGYGKFSEVFDGYHNLTGEHVVIKVLKPVKKDKIRRELLILNHLKECPYISHLVEPLRDPSSRTVILVFSFQNNIRASLLYPKFKLHDIQRYMYQLLTALDYTHSRGIIHRDIKPGNILIDPTSGVAKLSDWGLSEFYHPNVEYNTRVGTTGFKPPELLFRLHTYDYGVDMWSLGCTFGSMLFRTPVLFGCRNEPGNVTAIAKLVGSDTLYDFIEKYKLTYLEPDNFKAIGNHQSISLISMVTRHNLEVITDDGLDLLTRMLNVDPLFRISAHDALAHPFFDDVRHDPNILNGHTFGGIHPEARL